MTMHAWILPDVDVKPLDDLMFRSDGLLKVVPGWKLKEFPLSTLQLWCIKRGIYQFPTEELINLINWLSRQITGHRAIEICAGNGVLGRELGIISTDSYMQTKPEIIAYYAALKQEPIRPPHDVKKYDANVAVRHFKPEIVVGAWVTQKYQDGDSDGSVEGVNELEIIKAAKYIHVGNDRTHGYKLSMRMQHDHHHFDWLVSRGQDQSLNHIAMWGHYG